MSNVSAILLILINLRGVELGGGPGEGVRYYIGLRIRVGVRVTVKVKAKARVKVRVKVKVRFSREAIRGSRSRSLA